MLDGSRSVSTGADIMPPQHQQVLWPFTGTHRCRCNVVAAPKPGGDLGSAVVPAAIGRTPRAHVATSLQTAVFDRRGSTKRGERIRYSKGVGKVSRAHTKERIISATNIQPAYASSDEAVRAFAESEADRWRPAVAASVPDAVSSAVARRVRG